MRPAACCGRSFGSGFDSGSGDRIDVGVLVEAVLLGGLLVQPTTAAAAVVDLGRDAAAWAGWCGDVFHLLPIHAGVSRVGMGDLLHWFCTLPTGLPGHPRRCPLRCSRRTAGRHRPPGDHPMLAEPTPPGIDHDMP